MFIFFFVISLLINSFIAIEFEEAFRDCHSDANGFDVCIRKGLNAIRPLFKTGLPKYNVAPFDPFFAREISVMRGISKVGFTLTLRNVTESGWTDSKVIKFVSDLPNHKVVYTQTFPAKFLNGNYELQANFLNTKLINEGRFNLELYDLIQTTTVERRPGELLNAKVNVEKIRDLKLHITNLLNGRHILEYFLDKIINKTWQPGFIVTRGIINDLVSSAFTEIFGKAFQTFPFDKIFNKKKSIEPS